MTTARMPARPAAPDADSTDTATPGAVRGGKFLSFFLAGEEYGLEILKVHEIIGMMAVTWVPRTPDFVRGVINLRGKIIPIVDLRRKFGMPQADVPETCMIVVQLEGVQMGIVVDRVSEVVTIPAADVEPVPPFGASVNTDFLLGIAKTSGCVRLLLDIERVLSTEEVSSLSGVVSIAAEPEDAE